MSNASKIGLPVALLALIGFTGCNSDSGEKPEPAAAVSADPAASQSPAAPDGQAESAAAENSAAAAEKPKTPLDQMRERLNPEVLGPGLETSFARLTESISVITDEATAAEALPQLEGFYKQMNYMTAMAPLVPAESHPVIVEKVTAAMEPLQTAVNKIYENEEVKAKLQPVIDNIIAKLTSVAATFGPTPPAEETPAEGAAVDGDAESPTEAESETEQAASE